MQRIERVKQMRLASTAEATRRKAATPTLFAQIAQPTTDYLAVPEVSSERRSYIPIAFLPANVIASNTIQLVPNATLYHFGVLSSLQHMVWMKYVCGRLKSDYRYSKFIVYNNFPWAESPTEAQKQTVERAAQAVLDAREQFPSSSLADLYDPLAMPKALRDAHKDLDRAVDKCYRAQPFTSERQRVEYLFDLYQKLVTPLTAPVKGSRKPRRTADAKH